MLDTVIPSRLCDTDGQLLEALKQGSEELKNITDLFTPMMKNFRLFFFWEQEKTNLGLMTDYVGSNHSDLFRQSPFIGLLKKRADNSQVVSESSAAPIIDGTERCGLSYDHRNMCRFESRKSPGYIVIAAALIRYSGEAQRVIALRWLHMNNLFRSMRAHEAAELYQPYWLAAAMDGDDNTMTRQGGDC